MSTARSRNTGSSASSASSASSEVQRTRRQVVALPILLDGRLGSALVGARPGIVLIGAVRGAFGARRQRFVQTHRVDRP